MHKYQNMQRLQEKADYTCPTCNSNRLYHLADSRCKCAVCRRVFTPSAQKESKIPSETREQLAIFFWEMRGASEASEKLNLNIKTVQKYFSIMRENLAKTNRVNLKTIYGVETFPADLFKNYTERTGKSSIPLAAIATNQGFVNFLRCTENSSPSMVSSETAIGWLYASDQDALNHHQLDRFHCMPRDSDSMALTAPFWLFVKQGLIRYQGGFRHHFFLFLQEMEFRYNDRQIQRGLDICMQLLAAE